jgi:AraC family transcriptional regulator
MEACGQCRGLPGVGSRHGRSDARGKFFAPTSGVALKEVARECRLSVGHFSHAFRRTLGVAPHKWLIEQRVVLSKEELRDDGLSLSDVAAECGFSDQSHLTRAFRETVGASPGVWRRALKR